MLTHSTYLEHTFEKVIGVIEAESTLASKWTRMVAEEWAAIVRLTPEAQLDIVNGEEFL